jgi:hypothetical protein
VKKGLRSKLFGSCGVRLTVESESLKVAKEIMQKGVALVKKLIREMK